MIFVTDGQISATILTNAKAVLYPKTYSYINTTVDEAALYLKVSIIFSLSLIHYH